MHIVRPGGSQLISSRLQKSVMRTLWLLMGEPVLRKEPQLSLGT